MHFYRTYHHPCNKEVCVNMLGKKEKAVKKGGSFNISDSKVLESIRKRAYEFYCKRGYTHGNDVTDWLEAEKQVKKHETFC